MLPGIVSDTANSRGLPMVKEGALVARRRALSDARKSAAALVKAQNVPEAGALSTAKDELATASTKIDAAWRRAAGLRSTWALSIIGAVPGAVLIIVAGFSHWNWLWAGDALRYHAVAATATALLWIGVGALFSIPRGGLVRTVIGRGNRLSTSKLQVMLWTFSVSYAFLLFTVYYVWTHESVGFDTLNGDYLLLLGGPFAAALLAQATAVSKAKSNTIQQPDAPAPGAADLVEDPSGKSSTTDAQFLVFNLVALIYFYAALVQKATELPDLPDTLVGLTSISALAYVGGKITNANAPTIKSVSIVSGDDHGAMKAAAVIRIIGENFVTDPGQPEVTLETVVLFGAKEAIPTKISAKEIVVGVPSGVPQGSVEICVRTGAPSLSEPYTELSAV